MKGAGAEGGLRQKAILAAGNNIRVAVAVRRSAINHILIPFMVLCVDVVAFRAAIIFL